MNEILSYFQLKLELQNIKVIHKIHANNLKFCFFFSYDDLK